MRKADSLRAWLTACLPEYQANPEKLHIYVDEGTVRCRRSASLSFSYAYSIKALLTDFAGNDTDVAVAVLAWIEREQPSLLANAAGEPFSFTAEVLDSDLVDLQIAVAVTEGVKVILREDCTGYDVEPLPEPDTSLGMGTGCGGSTFLQGFGNVEELTRTSSPDAELTDAVPPAA